MPLARYFLFVGGVLLALIWFCNAYLPEPVQSAAASDTVRPVVRIHSAQKLPERIVIDTSIPTIIPPPTAVAEVQVKSPALDALAQVAPADMKTPQISQIKKAEPKAPVKHKMAKRQVRPPMMAYAQAPRFDFDFFARN
jgi:hypothetical protein